MKLIYGVSEQLHLQCIQQVLLAHDLVIARMPDATGDSALHVAAEMCNAPILAALLAIAAEADVDINMQVRSQHMQQFWNFCMRVILDESSTRKATMLTENKSSLCHKKP